MCDKDFSSPTSLDITDLLEYDEYDLDTEAADADATATNASSPALPLSAELALAGIQQQRLGHRLDDDEAFTRSPELFLRLDDPAVNDETTTPAFVGGVELQYENEFDENDGGLGEGGFAEASRSFHSMAENENEQLLMEGSFCGCCCSLVAFYRVLLAYFRMHQRYKSIMWLSSSPARSVLTINPASPHSGRRRQAWRHAPTLVRTFYRRDLSHRVIKNHGAHKPHTVVGYTRAAGSTPIRFHCNFTCAVAAHVLIITIRIKRLAGRSCCAGRGGPYANILPLTPARQIFHLHFHWVPYARTTMLVIIIIAFIHLLVERCAFSPNLPSN